MKKIYLLLTFVLAMCTTTFCIEMPIDTIKKDSVPPLELGQKIFTGGELTYWMEDKVVIECGYTIGYHGFSMGGNTIICDSDKKEIPGILLSFEKQDTCDGARISLDKTVERGIMTINASTEGGYSVVTVYGISVKMRGGAVEYWLLSPESVPNRVVVMSPLDKKRVIKFEKYKW